MDKLQNIQSIKFTDDQMILEIDNHKYIIDLNQVSNRLLNATEEQRNNFEISPANYGIHWPLIDEDLAVNNLIKSSRELSA
jgi:hypothetical protein